MKTAILTDSNSGIFEEEAKELEFLLLLCQLQLIQRNILKVKKYIFKRIL